MKKVLKKKQVYIDTNVFMYIATKHPDYYDKCYYLLRKMLREKFLLYGSKLVLFELFGAMSKINPIAAYTATINYLNLPIKILEPDRFTFELAKEIALNSGTTYDSIHAAIMIQNNINIIITEDTKDWLKIAEAWKEVKKKRDIKIDDLLIIQPSKYQNDII